MFKTKFKSIVKCLQSNKSFELIPKFSTKPDVNIFDKKTKKLHRKFAAYQSYEYDYVKNWVSGNIYIKFICFKART